jgi:SOS-response transcriptional repressor LexA
VRHDEPPGTAENIVETMFLSAANASPDDFFLVVDGDEMSPVIGRGDTVHIRRNAVVRTGDVVCVAFTDATPGVVRQYRTVGENHEFSSPGEGRKALRKKEKEFVLFGKVVKVIRPL